MKYPHMRSLCAATCLAALASPACAGPVLDRIRQAGKVVIAYREASVPFSYAARADGPPVGYTIDLCQRLVRAVAKQLGIGALRVEYLLVNNTTRISSVADGQADLACESTTNTAERRDRVAFTIPHYVTGARIVVRADDPSKGLADFRGRKLVSTTGTNPMKALDQGNRLHNQGIVVGEVADHAQGIHAVETGAADGFLMDEALLHGLIAARPDPSRLKIVGPYVTVEPLAIVLPRNDAAFKRIVDDEMRRLILSGEAAALHDQWFLQPIPPGGRNLQLKMPYLLKDFWKYPSDWVPN